MVSTYEPGGAKHKAEYVLNGKIVGIRSFDKDGQLELEMPLRNGIRQGTMFYFEADSNGKTTVTFAEPHKNGLVCGIARQWSQKDGQLIGTYSMKRGTGLDLWRNWSHDKKRYFLSEARYLKEGKWHGFEWWLNEDQRTVWIESYFLENVQHGIRREWNHRGRLKRGYPQYWTQGKRVSKRQYLRASAKDPTLPRFRTWDNQPRRRFPPEVLAAIAKL